MHQIEDIVTIDAELVGWGNGVRYGRGTNAAHYSLAGHKCDAAFAFALFCSGYNISAAHSVTRALRDRPHSISTK